MFQVLTAVATPFHTIFYSPYCRKISIDSLNPYFSKTPSSMLFRCHALSIFYHTHSVVSLSLHHQIISDMVCRFGQKTSFKSWLLFLIVLSISVIVCISHDFFAFLSHINIEPKHIYKGIDYLLEYKSEDQVRLLNIEPSAIKNIDTTCLSPTTGVLLESMMNTLPLSFGIYTKIL